MKTVTMTTVVVDWTSARVGRDHLAHLGAHVLQELHRAARAGLQTLNAGARVCSATAIVFAMVLPQI